MGLSLKQFEFGLAVERQADAQLVLILMIRLLVPADEEGAVLDDRRTPRSSWRPLDAKADRTCSCSK